jgi:hypothetical protein
MAELSAQIWPSSSAYVQLNGPQNSSSPNLGSSRVMRAVLGAADALGEPLAALLGDPAYYRRFEFELSTVYQITPPKNS